jgi:hypothetical protein
METTAIDEEMNSYFVLLSEEQKISVVQMIKAFLQSSPVHEMEDIEQYNKDIEEAEAEIERGEGISHEEVVNLSSGWLHGR